MNKDTKRYFIPQYLHRPYQVLFFETEELVMLILGFFLALSFGKVFWILFIILPFLMAKAKRTMPRGYLKHILYLTGLVSFKGAPFSFETKFRE